LRLLMDAVSGVPGPPPVAVGLNCCVGPEGILEPLSELLSLTRLPIVVQPNAGVPKQVDGRMIYMASPEYFATYAQRFVNMGARGVGGCCGTSPEHIREIARGLKRVATVEKRYVEIKVKGEATLCDPMPTTEKSRLGHKLAAGEWITTIEIVPPYGYSLEPTIIKARRCAEAGIDAINIPDGPRASSRLSPLVTALKIQDEAKVEAILHFCCRDRNLIGMQSDLLGCAASGVRNILFITGDPPKLGHYPNASAVFDADSIGLVKVQARLNRGVDIGGNAIDACTGALIGVGADPNALDMEREFRRTREKVEAGAEFIITQPVFAVEPLLKFLDQIGDLGIPVIAGIWPLASFRNAEFMKNEVPGVIVPDEIMTRMASADSKDSQRREGIAIARESVSRIRDRVRGIQVSAPFGNVDTALAVIQA
ncbi:MAG: bifunctional homocysteine S-methyltransferase/methylenetetrahydrofolate reductase, partial [Victivallales bacterium]|nr:bifunctional homocysteine S-methyltransferase/methylenetetrahydrofolate reductase [Victivallales bacterium]